MERFWAISKDPGHPVRTNFWTLSRDTDNAHSSLDPIFDAAKEQQRIDENRAIAQIGSQVADIVRTEGKIAAQDAAKNPDNLAAAKAALEAEGKTPTNADIAKRAYDTALNDYGTGSNKQKAVQAITAAVQGLMGGDWGSAVAGAAAPYMAELVKNNTAEGAERIISHAIAGAVVAQMQGGNAAAAAAGAGLSAAGAKYIAEALYPGKDIKDLSEEEKQGVVALATLASGIAGGVVGGDVSSGVDGGKAGRNEVTNNMFLISTLSELLAANNAAAAGAAGSDASKGTNTKAALALDRAIAEFGKDAVKQCLSGGSCPVEAAFALNLIAGMLNSDAESTPNVGKDLTDADKAELGGTGSGTPGGWGPEDEENARSDEHKITVDDLMSSSSTGQETAGRSKLFERTGGNDAANKEFDSLAPTEIKDIPGGRVGKLTDGRTVIVRERSTDGRPTLEIQSGKNRIKFRYDE